MDIAQKGVFMILTKGKETKAKIINGTSST